MVVSRRVHLASVAAFVLALAWLGFPVRVALAITGAIGIAGLVTGARGGWTSLPLLRMRNASKAVRGDKKSPPTWRPGGELA